MPMVDRVAPPSPGIRTPDQRLRVFVSSTLEELAPERKTVRAAIEQLRLAPVMFESGARPHPAQSVYRAYLAQSDVFVGIYWQSYGWLGPGMTISGLEDELALVEDQPRLLYVKMPAPDIDPRLRQMLDRIRAEGQSAYKTFTDTDELRELLLTDLATLLAERFGGDNTHTEPRGYVSAGAVTGHRTPGPGGRHRRGRRPSRRRRSPPRRADGFRRHRQDEARAGRDGTHARSGGGTAPPSSTSR